MLYWDVQWYYVQTVFSDNFFNCKKMMNINKTVEHNNMNS